MRLLRCSVPTARVLSFVLAAAACGEARDTGDASEDRTRPAAAEGRLDLEAVVARVRYGFRTEGDALVGGAGTYDVRVGPDAVSLEAVHFGGPGGEPRQSGPFRLRTRRVGGEPAGAGPATTAPDGHAVRRLGAVTEHWRNGVAGTEQSWELTSPPGEGAFEVVVEATGLPYLATTETGLHFGAGDGAPGFRYGHATWIDADGDETEVRARWTDGSIVLRVPADVVRSSRYPAVLDPTVSPEITIDVPATGPADNQSDVRVASNGTGFFAVWTDYRATSPHLRATRVDASGAILDGDGIALGEADSGDVASDGTDYLLVARAGSAVAVARYVVATGTLDPPVEIAASGSYPSIGWDGVSYAVAYRPSSGGIRLQRVAPDGSLVGAAVTVTTSTAAGYPRVAGATGGFLVAWAQYSDGLVRAARVSSAGSLLDAAGLDLGAGAQPLTPTVAGHGADWAVTWSDRRSGVNQVYVNRVTGPGAVLDGTGRALTPSSADVSAQALGPGPGGFLLTYASAAPSSPLLAVRLDAAASAVDDPPLEVVPSRPGHRLASAVAFGAGRWLVGFGDDPATGFRRASAARITSGGTVEDVGGFPLSSSDNAHRTPAVAAASSQLLVAWIDYRSTGSVVVAARLAADGTVLDPAGIMLDEDTPAVRRWDVDVASDGTDFLVVWRDGGSASATVVRSTGAVDSPGGVPVGSLGSVQRPKVAWGSGAYLVVGDQWVGGSDSRDIVGTLLSSDGTELAAGITLGGGPGYASSPHVAAIGGRFLACYTESNDVLCARVEESGTVLDTTPLPVAVDPTSGDGLFGIVRAGASWYVHVAGSVTDYRPVAFDGTLAPPLATGSHPVIASDGVDILGLYASADRLRGALTATDGYPLGSFDVEPSFGRSAARADLTAVGPNRWLAVYEYSPDGVTPEVLRARFIDVGSSLGEPCGDASECESGFCADGVCCTTACSGGCAVCTAAAGSTRDGVCAAAPAGIECRAAAGACDLAETCTGASQACPADGFAAAGVECRASAGDCDPAEACSGAGSTCPADARAPASTVCRAAAGLCDVAERCDGSSVGCPADALASTGTVCRAAADLCDAAETCDGSSAACPADALASTGTVCRPAAAGCDVAETCDGGSVSCPADARVPAGTECRSAFGVCDVAEACDGSSVACPADARVAAGTECRASAGACDAAEACDGSSVACPADALAPAGTECRAAAGACDVSEACDGSSLGCPADALAPAGTECRAAAGACDVPEACDGSSLGCPADVAASDGTSCADGLICNGDEVCAAGSCAGGTAPSCDDADPCTADSCAETGGCAHAPIAGCCLTDADCDDSDPCTVDACDTSSNTCSSSADPSCLDAGVELDAGAAEDAAVPDDAGASMDAGVMGDGAVEDAATEGDGAVEDAAIEGDGAVGDAATEGDGAVEDAATEGDGAVEDAAAPDAGPVSSASGGCGCRTAGPSPEGAAGWALLGLACVVAVRRRRPRSRRADTRT